MGPEGKSLLNIVILGFGFMFMFTAFTTCGNIEVNSDRGKSKVSLTSKMFSEFKRKLKCWQATCLNDRRSGSVWEGTKLCVCSAYIFSLLEETPDKPDPHSSLSVMRPEGQRLVYSQLPETQHQVRAMTVRTIASYILIQSIYCYLYMTGCQASLS